MNRIAFFFVVLATLQIVASSEISAFDILDKYMDGDKKQLFKTFHYLYKKHEEYPLISAEGVRRYKIFKSNLRYIQEENAKDNTYKLGLTPFADMTNEEYRNKILMKPAEFQKVIENLKKSSKSSHLNFLEGKSEGYTPGQVKINWESSFGPVRDQANCGSCWAFATLGAIEGNYKIKFGESLVLSTQQLVDCDDSNSGCNGGWPTRAFDYVKNNGVKLEQEYPYISGITNTKGTCTYKNDGLKILSDHIICPMNACSMDNWIDLLKIGPMEIGVDASSSVFQLYNSGVMNPTCTAANHAVVAYGIDSDSLGDYIMVRNSWSMSWGDNGNFKIRVNLANKTCFATDIGWLPLTQKPGPTPPPAPPTPDNSCPIFYEHCPYTGYNVQSCKSIINLAIVNMDFSLSSVKIGNAASIQLFSESECRGKSLTLTQNEECFDWDIDPLFKKFNDRANSLVVNYLNNIPPDSCIWVYESSCYNSSKQEICADIDDFSRFNFDDKIASIQFGKGVKGVIVYLDANFEGLSYGFSKNVGNIDQFETQLFVNAISSLRIEK